MIRRAYLAVLIAAVVVGSGAFVTAQTTGEYAITPDPSFDVPDRSVSYDGETYRVSETGRVDPGETVRAAVQAPAGQQYVVYLVDRRERVHRSTTATGNADVTFDTGRLDPGTYALAVVEDDDETAATVTPIVMSGYRVAADVPAATATDTETTVELTLSSVSNDAEPPNAVVVDVWDDSVRESVTASHESGDTYVATLPADALDPGTYQLVASVEGSAQTFGENEVLGFARTTLTVTEPTTATETATATETDSDGDGGAGGQPGGPAEGAPTAEPTATATATPTPTATEPATVTETEAVTETESDTVTKTPTAQPTDEPTATERTDETDAVATASPRSSATATRDSANGAPQPTEAAGGQYAPLVYALVLGLATVVYRVSRR